MRLSFYLATLSSIGACFAQVGLTTFQPLGAPFLSPVTTAPGFSAHVIFSNLTAPRGIAFDDKDNLLVVERGFGITAFKPAVQGGVSGWQRKVLIIGNEFTHAIAVEGSSLYLSTAGEVREYKYDSNTVTAGAYRVVVTGLPADGELTTHALLLERSGTRARRTILVGSGPLTNIDLTARLPGSGRSQVRRFLIPLTSVPPTWLSGQLVAYGIRNPAAFATAPQSLASSKISDLYILDNGASIDNVTGITPPFANDNPADELILVEGTAAAQGKFYGFPDCTTLWNGDADPVGVPQYVGFAPGDQFSFNLDPIRDDDWCRTRSNQLPPVRPFQAHSVPLDIKFYTPGPVSSLTSFPSSFAGDAFVSFRGSFDRTPPTGYGVIRVPFPLGSGTEEFIVQVANLAPCPGTCIRPVGVAFSKAGRLFVSSDSSRELFVVQYQGGFIPPPRPSVFPSPVPL
ncbi:hypothetical protein ONZ45_g5046 [Pleurotus djamor]|nr:hypothetical protein ONZ45_g5046 [Pleurotus djamor]